jgi:tRNA(fMet)-specific endonuclease VapC
MSLKYLLDTNVLSEPLRPVPNVGVTRRLKKHRDQVATAAPVWHELVYGLSLLGPSRRRTAIKEYLESVIEPTLTILPYDSAAAKWHGQERARLQKDGRTPPFTDGLIAAVAVVHGLVLVTDNVVDYESFDGLRIENWID